MYTSIRRRSVVTGVKVLENGWKLVGWLVRSFVDWLILWMVGSFVRSFVDWLILWMVGWLVGWLVGWWVGQSVGQSVVRSVSQPVSRSSSVRKPNFSLRVRS